PHLLCHRNVAEALGRIGPSAKEAIPGLTKLLKHREDAVRAAAVSALGEIAMTRPSGTIRAVRWNWHGDFDDEMIFCGSDFEYIASPCQVIVAVIRDRDTGKPLPGSVVRSYTFAGPGMPYSIYAAKILRNRPNKLVAPKMAE